MMSKLLVTLLVLFFSPTFLNAQCWTKIAVGHYHSLAIKSDGTLWAWGYNIDGQLGIGNTTDKSIPTQVGTDTDWIAIDALGNNSMAQKSNNTLWSWGRNWSGQIGNGTYGTTNIVTTPTLLNNDTDWARFICNGLNSFAIKNNGTLWGWGDNFNSSNNAGPLGTGDSTPHYTPFQIGTASDWMDIDSSGNYVLALKTNHTMWGWGSNMSGGLGIGTINSYYAVPTQTGNNTSDWAKLAVGTAAYTKIIKTDNTLWAMGNNNSGNIGNNTPILQVNTPLLVNNETNWKSVATSPHTIALKNDNTMWGWGENYFGQLGINNNTTFYTTPISIGAFTTWASISIGVRHSMAISTDGSLYAWGLNLFGEVGDGTTIDRNTITLINNSCLLNNSEFNFSIKLQLAPNPSDSFTTLHYYVLENALTSITILNNLGQVVYQQKILSTIGSNDCALSTKDLSTGIYIVTIETANFKGSCKLIKK